MSDIKKILEFVKPYQKVAFVTLFLMIIRVFMDLAIPRMVQMIIDQGVVHQNQGLIVRLSLAMLGITVLSTIAAIGNNNLSVQVGEGVAKDIREALFLKLQTLSFGNLDQLRTGELMVRLTSDISAVQRLVQISLLTGARAPLLLIGSLALMFSTKMSLAVSLMPVLILTSLVVAFYILKTEPMFLFVQQVLDKLNLVLEENISGIRLVKAFVRSDYEKKRFNQTNREFTESSIRVLQFIAGMSPVLTLCVNIGMVLVVWAGGIQAIRGELTIGEIVAFTNYLMTSIVPLTMMTMFANVWAAGEASAHRIQPILDSTPEVAEAEEALPLPDHIKGRIQFKKVHFHYNNACHQPILTDISLTIDPGKTLAILGATGSGKSTLIHMIPRFYDPVSGRITMDGLDLRSISQKALLNHIGMVPQQTILFAGSVRDNICYGRPEAALSDVIQAAKIAQIHSFIQELPNGYDSHIAQQGINLSGGQKQRIAIARALMVKPDILILDDATSSVDIQTENRIQEGIRIALPLATIIIVAQRISTVLRADKIVVLDKGVIAAEGSHAQLMQSSQIYQEIYQSQLGNGNHNSLGNNLVEEVHS